MVTEFASPPSVLPARASQPGSADCQIIDRDEYCRLLICNKTLVRWDDPKSSTRGLFDPATGIRYAISEWNLFRS